MKPRIAYHPGWIGGFTREQAPQARYANGSRVSKTQSKKGDMHPDGAQAIVLGSVYVPGAGCVYFVEFDARPREAVMITEGRLT